MNIHPAGTELTNIRRRIEKLAVQASRGELPYGVLDADYSYLHDAILLAKAKGATQAEVDQAMAVTDPNARPQYNFCTKHV